MAFFSIGDTAPSGPSSPLINLGMLLEADRAAFQLDLVRHLLHSNFKVADILCHKRAIAVAAKLCDAKVDIQDADMKVILTDLALVGLCMNDGKTTVPKEALAMARDRLKQSAELKQSWMAYPGLVALDAAVAKRVKFLSQDALAVECLSKAARDHPAITEVSPTSSHAELLEAIRMWKPWVSKFVEVTSGVSADFASSQPDLLASCCTLLKNFQTSVATRRLNNLYLMILNIERHCIY